MDGIELPGTYKVRDSRALGFLPRHRRAIRPGDFFLSGENMQQSHTQDSQPNTLASKLRDLNQRNRNFWSHKWPTQ